MVKSQSQKGSDPLKTREGQTPFGTGSKSLRWRLQIWHTGILLTVVFVFGAVIFYQFRRSTFAEVDAELLSGARVLEGSILASLPRPPGGPPNGPPGGQPGPPPPSRWGGRPGDRPGDRFGNRPGDPESPAPERLRQALPEELHLPGSMMFRRGPREDLPWFVVFGSDGSRLRESQNAPAIVPEFIRQSVVFQDFEANRYCLLRGPERSTIAVGRDVTPLLGALNRLMIITLLTACGVLAVGMAGGWWLSGRAIAPIERISKTAGSITASNLSRRIDAGEMDIELGSLSETLNSMLQRLEGSFEQQTRFTADASHELRTPLSVLIMQTELALSRDRSGEEYRETLQVCHRASQRMRQLVENLLTLAKTDAGKLALRKENTDLGLLVDESVGMLDSLGMSRNIQVEMETAPAICAGDSGLLLQVVNNLIHNSIVYNNDGGKVSIRTFVEGGEAVLQVEDNGPGIDPRDLPHLFERFYRVDRSRSREQGGSGLGLAICQNVAMAHGGRLEVKSELGAGSKFELRLPVSG